MTFAIIDRYQNIATDCVQTLGDTTLLNEKFCETRLSNHTILSLGVGNVTVTDIILGQTVQVLRETGLKRPYFSKDRIVCRLPLFPSYPRYLKSCLLFRIDTSSWHIATDGIISPLFSFPFVCGSLQSCLVNQLRLSGVDTLKDFSLPSHIDACLYACATAYPDHKPMIQFIAYGESTPSLIVNNNLTNTVI